MHLVKETIFLTGFCTVIAYFCKVSPIWQLADLISAIPRSRFRWLHAISGCGHTAKLYHIVVSHISAKSIICIIISGPPGYADIKVSCVGPCLCLEGHGFPFFKGPDIYAAFRCLFQHICQGQPAFFIQCILFLGFFNRCIQLTLRMAFCFWFTSARSFWLCLGGFRFPSFSGSFCIRQSFSFFLRQRLRLLVRLPIICGFFCLPSVCRDAFCLHTPGRSFRSHDNQVPSDLIDRMVGFLWLYIVNRLIDIRMFR